jgi:hypothetical protein
MQINASNEAEIKPPENLISWIFNEGSLLTDAKLLNKESHSIVTDHLGIPCENLSAGGEFRGISMA